MRLQSDPRSVQPPTAGRGLGAWLVPPYANRRNPAFDLGDARGLARGSTAGAMASSLRGLGEAADSINRIIVKPTLDPSAGLMGLQYAPGAFGSRIAGGLAAPFDDVASRAPKPRNLVQQIWSSEYATVPVLATSAVAPEFPAAVMAAQAADAQARRAREAGRYATPAADAAVLTNAGTQAVLGRLQAEALLGRPASVLVERLPPQIRHWAVKAFADMAATSGSQYALGSAQQFTQNAVNKGLIDPKQDLDEGVTDAGASSAITGGALRAGGLGVRAAAVVAAEAHPKGLRLQPRVQAIADILSHQRAPQRTLSSPPRPSIQSLDETSVEPQSGYPVGRAIPDESGQASIRPGEITT